MRYGVSGAGILVAIACTGLAGCLEIERAGAGGEGELATSEQALLNGIPTDERPEVGIITNIGCTATLIRPTVILTAAHCVDFQTGPRSDGFLTGRGEFFPIDRVISRSTSAPGWGDLAVAHLTVAVPPSSAIPSPHSTGRVSIHETVTVYGYGCIDRANPSVGYGTKRKFTYPYITRPRLLCPGDSGGPTYRANGTIFLVNSGYHNDGSDIYANVEDNASWVSAAISALGG